MACPWHDVCAGGPNEVWQGAESDSQEKTREARVPADFAEECLTSGSGLSGPAPTG